MKIDHEAVLKRLKERVRKSFPLNCRVRMTKEAAQMFPKYKDALGTVVGYSHGISPSVRWDGRKTASGYHPDFVRRVRK
jgi:hypothetical protein